MDYDRLRELQAKFDENPRRYFAPLANEYRKGGNPKRAIEICRAHLAQMPGHMSGQVVYGQSLFEGGEHEEARKVFEGVVVLDPENLIALRSLGNLALQAGDNELARSWYTRLLEADPKDAAVIDLLTQIDASADAGPPAAAAKIPGVDLDGGDQAIPQTEAASSESQNTSEFTVDFSFVDKPAGALPVSKPHVPRESAATREPEPPPESSTEVSPAASSDAAADTTTAASSKAEGEVSQSDAPLGLERHYPTEETAPATEITAPTAGPTVDPVPALAEPMGPDRDALDTWTPPAGVPVHQEAAPSSDETSPASSTASSDYDSVPFGDPPVPADASSMFANPTPTEPVPSPFAGTESVPSSSGTEPGPSSFAGANPEPFVNETMAQLYLQQGYKQLALRVYRQLAERKPNEQSFRDKIAEIEASQAAEAQAEARRQDPPSIESPIPEPAAPRAPSTETPVPHGPGSQPASVESPGFEGGPDSTPSSFPSGEPDSIDAPPREAPRAEPELIAARQPSMKEFFATLGRRRPPKPTPAPVSRWTENPAPPPAAPVPEPPQAASLDAVFAGAKVSATDARAASTLAGAFSVSSRGTSAPSPAANPTPRANPRLQTQESEEDVAKFRAWLDGLTGE